MINQKERQQWFAKRIGRRIWRTRSGLVGPAFDQVWEEGFIIRNKAHAEYLPEKEDNFAINGVVLKHFGTRTERDRFESKAALSLD